MSKKIFITCFSLICTCIFVYSGDVDQMDRFIQNALKEWNVPGASVVIVEGDQVLLAKGYGAAKAGTGEKVDRDTIFQLASITKAFTAAALGIQVDRGNLTWDEEVIAHLPQFALNEPYPTRYTSARDLLAHRTGLPAFGGDLMGKIGYTNQEILARVRYIEPKTSFRNKPFYSNLGYFVAGELLSAITGKTWEESLQETLLSPLKMTRSGFDKLLQGDNVAHGHVSNDGELKVVKWDTSGGFPAAGALNSTASDMGNWMRMLLNGGKGILQSTTIEEMFASTIPGEIAFSEAPPIDQNSGFNFGLGWDNYHYGGTMVVEKGGGLDGIRTVTTLVPERKLGITVLCNLNLTLFPEAVRAKFLEEFVKKSSRNLQKEIRERQEALDDLLREEKSPSHPLPPRALHSYTGVFGNQVYAPFKVFEQKGKLYVHAGNNNYEGTLKHFSANTFTLSWSTVNMGHQKITFIIGSDGKAIGFETETLGSFKFIK